MRTPSENETNEVGGRIPIPVTKYDFVTYDPMKTTYCSQKHKQKGRSKLIIIFDSEACCRLVSASASDSNNLVFIVS